MNILLVNPPYPYGGKRQIYLPTSLCMLAGIILADKKHLHTTKIIDLNFCTDSEYKEAVDWADLCCLSIVGLPFVAFAREFAKKMNSLQKPFCIGGQGIENFPNAEIKNLFPNIILQKDFWEYTKTKQLNVSMVKGFEVLNRRDLEQYLENEMPVFVGDHCVYKCDFCAARKGAVATVRNLQFVKEEISWLQNSAQGFGISRLDFYATSLDFFQTKPKQILEMLADCNKNSKVKIHVRCLATIQYTELTIRKILNLSQLCETAGLHTIGLGEDGDESVWKVTNKGHNDRKKFLNCLRWGKGNGVTFQVLQVSGFYEQSIFSNLKGILRGLVYSIRYAVQIRPYVAKVYTPIASNWNWGRALLFTEEWKAFDYSAVATRVSHPKTSVLKRCVINCCFLFSVYIVPLFSRAKSYTSPPVFPEWNKGIVGKFWKWINSKTGFDI